MDEKISGIIVAYLNNWLEVFVCFANLFIFVYISRSTANFLGSLGRYVMIEYLDKLMRYIINADNQFHLSEANCWGWE